MLLLMMAAEARVLLALLPVGSVPIATLRGHAHLPHSLGLHVDLIAARASGASTLLEQKAKGRRLAGIRAP